jgi:hypothetical protein
MALTAFAIGRHPLGPPRALWLKTPCRWKQPGRLLHDLRASNCRISAVNLLGLRFEASKRLAPDFRWGIQRQ